MLVQRDFGVLIGLEWKWLGQSQRYQQQDKVLHFLLKKKQTKKQGIQKLIWMKWACNKFWRKYSDIHMNLWSNSGLGGFGFESMFTLLSFQARQFSRSARSYFLEIIDDFENARSCERTGLARLYKLYLFGDKFVRIRLWKDPSPNIQICELECSWTAYEDWKEINPLKRKKIFSMRLR